MNEVGTSQKEILMMETVEKCPIPFKRRELYIKTTETASFPKTYQISD